MLTTQPSAIRKFVALLLFCSFVWLPCCFLASLLYEAASCTR